MTPKGRSAHTASTSSVSSGQSALLHRAGFQPGRTFTTPPSSSGIARASTLPTFNGSPTNYRTPTRSPTRPAAYRTTSTTSNASTNSTATRNKGVQMVSEMRARVRILEQKIHTRVPRLRMGSVTNRTAANAMPPPPPPPTPTPTPPPPSPVTMAGRNEGDYDDSRIPQSEGSVPAGRDPTTTTKDDPLSETAPLPLPLSRVPFPPRRH